jgi:hypothetical protein
VELTIHDATRSDVSRHCRLVEAMSGREIASGEVDERLEMIRRNAINSLFVCEGEAAAVGILGFGIRENLEEVSRYGKISAIVVTPEARRLRNRRGFAGMSASTRSHSPSSTATVPVNRYAVPCGDGRRQP